MPQVHSSPRPHQRPGSHDTSLSLPHAHLSDQTMQKYPPSPACSMCSDDLDAMLDAAGPMSRFPTPPLPKDDVFVGVIELPLSDEDSEWDGDENDESYTADVLTQEASLDVAATPVDIELVRSILLRAQLPPELIAFAYNILRQLNTCKLDSALASSPSDLLVACAFSLAVSYTDDHPPSYRYWARQVCDRTWTARRIDQTTLQILLALDFRLHECFSPPALELAMSRLTLPDLIHSPTRDPSPSSYQDSVIEPREHDSSPVLDGSRLPHEPSVVEFKEVDVALPPMLKLDLRPASACWANGQVTPEATPSVAKVEFAGDCFLPLL